jgi:hypothetical protein
MMQEHQSVYFCSEAPGGSGADEGWRSITMSDALSGMQKLGERASSTGWTEASRSAGSRDWAGWQLRVRPDMLRGVVFGCWNLRRDFFIALPGYFEQKK